MDIMEHSGKDVPSFTLVSSSTSFSSRSKDIFESLSELEKKHKAHETGRSASTSPDRNSFMKDDPLDEENEQVSASASHGHRHESVPSRMERGSRNSGLSRTRGLDMESTDFKSQNRKMEKFAKGQGRRCETEPFRQPRRPPKKSFRPTVPDFKKHPERWTCYTLDDVADAEMSDRSNTRAAFIFLEERRREREREERKALGLPEQPLKFDTSYGACSKGRLSFSKPNQKKNVDKSRHHDKEQDERTVIITNSVDRVKDSESHETPTDEFDSPKHHDGHNNNDEVVETVSNTNCLASTTFKSRKNVKRHIRSKDLDSD